MKKNSNCIKIKLDIDKLKNIITLDDYFIITGLAPYLKDRTLKDVRQISINKKTGEEILNCWQANWKKNKELKYLKKKYALCRIAMTWLNYSPCYEEDVPEGYIYLKKNI